MEQEDVVLVEKKGRLGLITLNRPKAVNALSLEMVQKLDRALEDLEQDEQIAVVAVVGAGERGLCAGGDVRALYTACTGDAVAGLEFFRNEYALDLRIHDFPKPYVPIMSGLVLGGGVGISAPGSHRVATDSTRIGMPETGIGFSPDVGGSNLLSRAPGQTGALMALTGQHAGGADALYLGLADYYVPDASVPALLEALQTVQGGSEVGAAIRRFQAPVPTAPLAAAREWADEVFSAETVEGILDRLRAVVEQAPENDAAAAALESLERNSPTGQKVALEALRRAREQSFAQTLDQDFRLAGNAIFGHDMREGIRAQVVDKDRNPQWSPAAPEEVDRDAVLAFFEPVPEQQDLGLAGEPVILTETPAGGVGLIRLNRPKALNALNAEIMHAVVEQARAWDADPDIKAVVITGSQKAFAAGADIKEMASKTYPEMAAADWFADWKGLTEVRIPVIAAVSGHALGGGCELAMMCDLLVAGEGARFGQPEVNLGVMPGMGGSQRLARAVGKAKAMDMVLTGRTMGAEEAERAGLVSRLVADDAVLDTALEIAGTIASKSRPVETAAKEAVNTAFETTLAHGIEHERRVFHSLFALEDQKEGMAAFSEKRKARFRDR